MLHLILDNEGHDMIKAHVINVYNKYSRVYGKLTLKMLSNNLKL
jgi:hypothetical protein